MSAHHSDVCQVVIKGTLHGQETNNVLHFGATGLEPNYAQLIIDIIDCIFTALRPAVSEDWRLTSVSARRIFPTLGDPHEGFPDEPTLGTGLPGGVSFSAYLVQIRTGLGGRSHRGRFFIPGTIENDVNQSQLTDAGYAKVLVFLTCMIGKFITTNTAARKAWELGVLSRKLSTGVGGTVGLGFFEGTTLILQRDVACMRSRRRGHGN